MKKHIICIVTILACIIFSASLLVLSSGTVKVDAGRKELTKRQPLSRIEMRIDLKNRMAPIAIAQDGATIACVSIEEDRKGAGIEIWNVETGDCQSLTSRIDDGKVGVGWLAFSNNGRYLGAQLGGGIAVWELRENRWESLSDLKLKGEEIVFCNAFRKENDKIIIYAWKDEAFNMFCYEWSFKFNSLKLRASRQFEGLSVARGTSQYGKFAYVTDSLDARVVNDSLEDVIECERNPVWAFSGNERLFIEVKEELLVAYDLSSGLRKDTIRLNSIQPLEAFEAIAMSEDGELMAIADVQRDDKVVVLDFKTRKPLGVLECGSPQAICEEIHFSGASGVLATATGCYTAQDRRIAPHVRVWNVKRP